MVEIRPAQADDAPEMARIQVAAIRRHAGDYYSDEQMQHLAPSDHGSENISHAVFDDNSYYSVIAKNDDTTVGFSVVHLNERYLSGIFVDPNHAGNGVGTDLLRHVENHCCRENIQLLETYAAMNAVGFYESCGFEVKEEIDANEAGSPDIPAIRMQKKM
ncbi:GNAT family N-acetyltransferase [Halocatena pleomorpha]|uniref:GNAT family N-acetyltransferase n=1 Tax=Halocatena pleomorpha TaxID=1785090 RepID=A0A3P3RDN4_9EURY|nr:GNAT family N-acetyltransferase [Halocatena pleomorpha]RRJ31511.1 GNAT family N-acetyltransferase [Halocatena pleomorpha]